MYSSIIRKKCKCGCSKWPSTGFGGYNAACNPAKKKEIMDKHKQRQEDAMKGIGVKAVAAPQVREQTKSELLQEADRLFASYIKERDTGKNGTMFCPCCNKVFNSNGVETNCMHFIDRDVYSLRFDEDAAHAGHAKCNKNQHYNPTGIEYQNFKEFLIKQLGKEEVEIMELEKRKVNKITETQLKNIIEHYSQA